MTTDGETTEGETADRQTTVHDDPAARTPTLPWSIWLFAWSFVPPELYELVTAGVQSDARWPVEVLLGIAVTTFFSHGVLRARLVRFSLVLLLLVLALPVQLYDLVREPTAGMLVGALLTLGQIVLLLVYTRSAWFRWHRQSPEAGPADAASTLALVPILAVAALVGVLGGLVGTATT